MLKKYAIYIDPRLVKPANLQLHVEEVRREEDGKGLIAKLYYKTDVGMIDLPKLAKLLPIAKDTAMEKNHTPIIIPTNRLGANTVIIDSPMGESSNSPTV